MKLLYTKRMCAKILWNYLSKNQQCGFLMFDVTEKYEDQTFISLLVFAMYPVEELGCFPYLSHEIFS